jgi:hypothetical protein
MAGPDLFAKTEFDCTSNDNTVFWEGFKDFVTPNSALCNKIVTIGEGG